MDEAHYIKARIPAHTKDAIRAAASRDGITESIWLRRAICEQLRAEHNPHTDATPFPKAELDALRQTIEETRRMARALEHMARQSAPAAVSKQDLITVIRVCEALKGRINEFLVANYKSWRGQS